MNNLFNSVEQNRVTSIEARLIAIEAELKRICYVLGRHDALLKGHDTDIEMLKRK